MESPNHQLLSKSGKEKVRTQLSFRVALDQQLIGTYRGSRKRKLVSVVDNCGMLIGQQNLKRGVEVNCATKTKDAEK